MKDMGLSLLMKKLEKELIFYMGRNYSCLKIEGVEKAGTIYLYISDNLVHLEPMEKVNLEDILKTYARINSENVCSVLSDIAELCVQKYEVYKKQDAKKAEELSKMLKECPSSRIFCFPAENVENADVFVHRKKGAIFFFYGVNLDTEKHQEIRFLPFLKTELLETWNLSEEDLYYVARQNTRQKTYIVENLDDDCYIIRRESGFWGGIELVYPEGALYELSSKLQENLYVLLLSPHELIAVSEREGATLKEAAREIGRSEYIFYYDKDLQEIAVNAAQKEEIACRKKQGVLDVAEKNLLEGYGV